MFVVVLRADKTISGLAYRLLATAKHFYDSQDCGNVLIVTTISLWEKCYPNELINPRYIKLIDDRNNYKPKMLFLWLRCLWYILINRISIMHTNGNFLLLPVHYLKVLFSYKTVVTFGSASIEMASGNNRKIANQWRTILDAASAIDVLNPINSIEGYRSKKFISACSFPYNLKEIGAFNNEGVIKQNIITFIGSLTLQKNPLLALDGFEMFIKGTDLKERHSLHIIGKGPLYNEVKRRADYLNQIFGAETVVLHKDDRDIIPTLVKSRIFLSLQRHTNYPSQSLMEAMLLGNDIIATNYGDTSEMVKSENNNILISRDDGYLVSTALTSMLSTPPIFNIKNAEFIRNNHNLQVFSVYLKNLYEELLHVN